MNSKTAMGTGVPAAAGISPLARAGRALIAAYQNTIGPLLPASCRFYPSCSRFTHQAIGRFGFWRGTWMGLRRVGRCNPFVPGGADPVPERKAS